MKHVFTIYFILTLSYINAQSKVVTLLPPSGNIWTFGLFEINDTIYCPYEDYTGVKASRFLRLNYDLNVIDTLTYSLSEDSLYSYFKIMINTKEHILYRKIQNGNDVYYARRLHNGRLSDSLFLPIDTILRGDPMRAYSVDANTTRMIIAIWDTNHRFIENSAIVDLDSNFTMKTYHTIDVQPGVSNRISLIFSVTPISDTLWHIHTSDALYLYNPQTKQTIFGKELYGEIQSYYKMDSTKYLGFGTVAQPTVPGQPGNYSRALGFYRINSNGDVVETAKFNTVVDSSTYPRLGYINYSEEDAQVPIAIVYDTNNIFLATQSDLSRQGPNEYYFIVVKTNSRGDEYWRYVWEGSSITNMRTILPTPDGGCIMAGLHFYEFPLSLRSSIVLIKLGPDGTISNVEFDAPETVISFYPNPVKDRLYYDFLPEAKGPYSIEIRDMHGKLVLSQLLEQNSSSMNINLKEGFYLYNLKTAKGETEQVGKLVVE
ncbi:T9SS type A sorting domain-containing protein [Owenweeksia hongkongensis]|uniref:T9SS type A sorting domain-containing protein n=1 Tax=Owenweeksia hongkongensis TaxID=253245 RepID=UPI003A8D0DF7